MESFLLNKGFTTFNLSPSTPADSVLNFMRSVTPDAVIISITLSDSIPAGQRLAKKIKKFNNKIPILACGHDFHWKCLETWVTKHHNICPICKEEVKYPYPELD